MMPENNLNTILKRPATWYYFVMAVFGLLYFTTSIANHYLFRTVTEDYGTYNFAFWDYAHFRVSKIPSLLVYGPSRTFMQDHFSLTLFYLIPFYWLLNWLTGTYTLLIIQLTLVLLSGVALHKLIELKTGDKWLAVLALLYYFLLHGHYSMFAADFNRAIIGACTLPIFLYYFESNRLTAATVILILSLFSREDMPLCYVFICFVLLIWHRKNKKKRLLCSYYIVGSIVYFILVFTIFIPLTESADTHYKFFNFSALGKTPLLAVESILTHPIHALSLLFTNQSGLPIFNNVKTEFYLVYLISGGFLVLFRPYYIIWFMPLIAQKMFDDSPIRWSIETYYSLSITTMLPITVFLIIPEIKQNKLWRHIIGISICILAAMVTIYIERPEYKHAIPWIDTGKENIISGGFFSANCNVEKVNEALSLIPPNARVSASSRILPHLAQRKGIYEFPDIEDAQFIAVFTYYDFYAVPEKDYWDKLNTYLTSPQWNIIAQSYPFVLLKKEPNRLKPSDFITYDTGKMKLDSLCDYLANRNMNFLANESSVLVFVKEPNRYKPLIDFSCDAESLSPDSKSLVASNHQLIDMGGTYTTERAHSGKHSVKLGGEKPFGMNYKIDGLRAGDIIQVHAWRFSSHKMGKIVISGYNNDFYYVDNVITYDTNGWEELSLTMVVGNGNGKFKLYALNTDLEPVYFDDMEVKVFTQTRIMAL